MMLSKETDKLVSELPVDGDNGRRKPAVEVGTGNKQESGKALD